MKHGPISLALLLGATVVSAGVAMGAGDTSPFAHLTYRNIGPTTGRIDAVTGIPGDSTTYFAGGLGGLWRTRDGGVHWTPVFDDKPVTAIGDVVVAPSNHNILYVGTGEPNIRNDIAYGDGVWRSNSEGSTWTHRGLDATAQIAQIAVDPHDADIAYVAAVGDPFTAGPSRGVYKTIDGGLHWSHVLAVDDTTGASSVVISPADSKIVYAGMWTVQRRPWMLTSGGRNDGLYRSTDAGAHWTRVRGNGFAQGLTGRIGLAFAPSNARRLYAVVESASGVFWSSNDGGYHWRLISTQHVLDQRPYYFSQFTVDPRDANHLYFMSIVPSESKNGGKTTERMKTNGYDHHQMWVDPVDGERAIIGADAGVRLSVDGGKTWRDPQLIVAQPYHISTDNGTPYTVCGEFQDPGAVCGPSLSFTGSITPDQWFSPQAGESGWIVFSPANPNIIYGTGYQAAVIRFDKAAMQARIISPWPDDYAGLGAAAYKYRGAWVAPVAVSALEPDALYFGAQYLMKTEDGGQTWREISPDLTRNDKSKQILSGQPITVDNAGTEVYDTIAVIAESPRSKGELWIGTDDGLVWLSRDGGAHWANLSAAIPNLPHWARINNIDPSPELDGTAYVVAENHKLGDRTPYVYVTRDFGQHWSSIAGNLPRDSYARMIRADPVRVGMLYVGTETGLWLSYDDGAHWQLLLNNLAHLPIYDLVVQPHFDDLVVATHGRGVWILDDISPLQRWSSQIQASPAYLFPVRQAYRWNASWSTWVTGEGGGDNPPGNAVINFYLRDPPAKKSPNVKVQIYDGTTLVRALDVKKVTAGINRVWWDLTYDAVKTVPDYHAIPGDGFTGLQVLPGTYTVRLVAGGKTQDQVLRVLPDPKTPGSQADMRASLVLALRLRGDYQRTGQEIVALRALADALAKARPRVAPHVDTAAALAAMQASTDKSLDAIYISKAQSWEDTLRLGPGIYERLINVGGGLVGTDYPPTAGQVALAGDVETQMNALFASDDTLFGSQLMNLNALLRRDGVPVIAVKREASP
jgi:photosystem II stability/assembly factor-like uncharacterized protein